MPGCGCPHAALGQQPRVAGGEQPRPVGIAGAAALAEAAVAAGQAVGGPAIHELGGQVVGGGAPQAAGSPRQQPSLERPQPGQHGQPPLLSPPLAPAPLGSAAAILRRLGSGAVGAGCPVPLRSGGDEAGQKDGGTQEVGIDGSLRLDGEPGAEAGRRGAGAAADAMAPGQAQAGEGWQWGARAAAALGQRGRGQPSLGASPGFARGHGHCTGTPQPLPPKVPPKKGFHRTRTVAVNTETKS